MNSIRPGTYSVVARDPKTGEMGVAVQSHWFSVGRAVPWAEAGVGAVATQSMTEISYGPLGLSLMRAGKTASEALKGLIVSDNNSAVRQVAMLDASGNVMAYTGEKCIPEAGHIEGKNYSVQANLMLNDRIWLAMAEAFDSSEGSLPERMLLALEAAQKAGGDIRGQQSAAMITVEGKMGGDRWKSRLVDLRVDDSSEPLRELRRLVKVSQAYSHMKKADKAIDSNNFDAAQREYETAEKLYPENPEMKFWHAISLINENRMNDAAPILRGIITLDSNWASLLPNLQKVGLIKTDANSFKSLLTKVAKSKAHT